MIVDILENADLYSSILPKLEKAIAYARSAKPESENGKFELPEIGGFALVMSYETEPAADRKLETHNRFADLQVILSGREMMQWAPVIGLQQTDRYDADEDVAFWGDGPCTELIFEAGMFAIYLPGDAHKPNCSIDPKHPQAMKKLVVKVPVE